jgi:acyl-CoA synthetase (AMP-forming)/AMP-acid ligase II
MLRFVPATLLAPPAPLAAPATAPVPFVRDLAAWGARVAVVGATETLTYTELAARVEDAAAALGATRQLVLLAAENSVEWLVTYLAALRGGHAVLLAPGDRPSHLDGLVQAYQPGFVASRAAGDWSVAQRGAAQHDLPPDLHPDLALLLTTSGSTGSPKLVRLSHENLDSNARSIVEALSLTDADRAMTTLPVHYSYGLSIVHSHLACGGSIVLSDHSVIDPCFWDLFHASGATGLSGVPHTYDLLDRVGFASMDLPTLRTLTQAGGAMAPSTTARFRRLAADRGWRFLTMYGQTEATARMAVLPPDLAAAHPDAVGRAIPGGAFRVDPLDEGSPAPDPDTCVGELVYTGPNVMLGYAHSAEDLGRGRELHELRTGDLGTVDRDGVVRVVGRRSRMAKVLGLRLDLDHLERDLGQDGEPVRCVELDGRLGVATPAPSRAESLRAALQHRHGLPPSSVTVLDGCDVPFLSSGKPDYATLRKRLASTAVTASASSAGSCDEVVDLYRTLLARPDAGPHTSFVDLGGDSLSYVEVSVRLEAALGHLPPNWHQRTPTELAGWTPPSPATRRSPWRRVETNVVIRALAVVLILANHTKLADLPGGAHTLLVIAGFNLARFQLTHRSRTERAKGILAGLARVWAPSAVWIAGVAFVAGTYDWRNVLLLNQVLGDWSRWSPHWHFWFVEALVALLLGTAALCLVPAIDRLERRHPFGLPMALVGVGLLTRYAVLVPDAGPYRGANAYVLLWLFATGWAAARASSRAQRLLLSAVPVLTLPGFWPTMPGRELTIIGGVLLLIWVPTLPVPARAARALSIVATASLFTYLTHFVVYPHVMDLSSGLAVLASLAVGLAYWHVWTRTGAVTRTLWSRLRQPGRVGRTAAGPVSAQGDVRVASA